MSGEKDPDPSDIPPPGASLRTGLALSELDLHQLWVAHLGLGGTLSPTELRAALHGEHTLSAHEHDLVAQALNDYFIERDQDHPVAYSDDIAEHRQRHS
jgi:hypothetical protein